MNLAGSLQEIAVEAAVAALARTEITIADVLATRISAIVDDRPVLFDVVATAYCTGARARELMERHDGDRAVPFLVADKITAEARGLLTEAGWSWLDRRGRLHLRGPAIRVDVTVPSDDSSGRREAATRTVGVGRSRSGVAVAYWLCAHPGEPLSPTGQREALGLAPSTISVAVRRLRDAGLVDEQGAAVLPELFWELAAVWRPERIWLANAPEPQAHSRGPGSEAWRRAGTAAAAAHGAPVASAGAGPLELYVPGPVLLSILLRRHGSARPGMGAASVAVAPARPVVRPMDQDEPLLDGWPLAPVLAVALDLAQDRARGREILDDWRHPDAVWR